MYFHRLILLLVSAGFIASPVIIDWWLSESGSWYSPFALWLILIGGSVLLQHWQEKDNR
ncbi:MAG: hypothetical protein ACJAYK_000197 [Crocinitomicaceae bacterium]|jgi:hypothetical protein